MSSASDPAEGAARVHKLAGEAYWKRKNLSLAVGILQAGIEQGRAAAEQSKSSNFDRAVKILGNVKAMSFDLASFTWDGWDEPGIVVTEQFCEIGRKVARMNYELAIELKRPSDKVALAQWMIGAHALSARDFPAAIDAFAAYRELSQAPEHRFCADGYLAMAKILGNRKFSESENDFARAVTQLKEMNTDDSKFFAEQLLSVRKFFETKGK